MISPDVPTGYTRSSGYPKGNRAGGINTVIDRFFIASENFDLGSLYEFDNLEYGDLVVNSSSWEANENQARVFVTVNYSEPNSAGVSWSATLGKPEYTLDDSGQEIPIDKRKQDGSLWFPNYQTRHNYILAAKKGIDDPPNFWDGAGGVDVSTNLTMSPGDSEDYKWIKDAGELPDGWYILQDKTKNIEAVLVPSPVVVETTYFKTYTDAVRNIVPTGVVKEPGKTFGKTGQWLVTNSSVDQDGKRWAVVTRYQMAIEWDSDYYAVSS